MSESLPVLICANPFSGKGSNADRVGALTQCLEQIGIATQVAWGLEERKALLSDPAIGERYRCIVSAGGDGSIASAINDLAQGGATARIPIAMLPIGNENLFAIEFAHNQGEATLAKAISRGKVRHVDAGRAGDRLFTLMTSVGFDSEVVKKVDAWRQQGDSKLKRVSRASYGPQVLVAAATYRYPRLTLEADGQRIEGAHAFVFNIGQYAGNVGLGRHTDPSDGLLDWMVFEKPGLVALLGYGLSVVRGRHLGRKDVKHGRSKIISITSDRPAVAQIDGDPGGMTPIEISVVPGALSVIDGAARS